MSALQAIATAHNIPIIEDSAQAVGATYHGKKAGAFGRTGCFSLHPLKNLHVHGDGGVLTTNDKAVYDDIMMRRNHGLENRDNCAMWGINSRLDAIQAGIATIKLPHMDAWTQRYRAIAHMYTSALSEFVSTPTESEHEKPVYHRYMIRTQKRDELQSYLAEKGVDTKVNYPIPIHLQTVGRNMGHKEGDFPETERAAQEILSLPLYPELTDEEVGYVIDTVRSGIKTLIA